jgi:DNA-binding NarL/FixJ family response regulator
VTGPRILLVEDEVTVGWPLKERLEAQFAARVRFERSVEGGRRWLDAALGGGGIDGAVMDVGLPDGSGLSLVERIRAVDTTLPVMVLTGSLGRPVVNRAHELGVDYVLKPAQDGNFRRFMASVASARAGREAGDPVAAVVEEYQRRCALTVQERRMLELTVKGLDRARLGTALGISENTVKTYARRLLQKTKATSLVSLAAEVLRRALALTDSAGVSREVTRLVRASKER